MKRKNKPIGLCLYPDFDEANQAILAEEKEQSVTVIDSSTPSYYGSLPYSYNTHPYTATNGWCAHKGDKLVFEAEGKQLYGASGRELDDHAMVWDLIIDLASNIREPRPFVESNSASRFKVLNQHTFAMEARTSELLSLDWNDAQGAPATLTFWKTLWKMLPATTVVACFGGHGRTGTCLTALLIASGVDYYSALNTVRTEHCHRAVETLTQERYLHSLYLDDLRARLKTSMSKNDRHDLEEDLIYAEAHVPEYVHVKPAKAHAQSVGYPSVAPAYEATLPVSQHEKHPTYGEMSDRELLASDVKCVNGEVLVRTCTNPKCCLYHCKIESHQNWVPWEEDPELARL